MQKFGSINKLNLRKIWPNEASDFTPWLEKNIIALGEALGLELDAVRREANVGGFSLDLLAKDVSSGRDVIIENQITATDHDHLGKLLTYSAGFDASIIIWIAESLREEHRQALEWLNQKTDADTAFFGVVIEVIQIDDSLPAYNFKPVVFPNEWQKSRRGNKPVISERMEAYRSFMQKLIDELREKHKFTGARVAQPQSWYLYSSGFNGINYGSSFAQGKRVRAEVYIDQGDREKNKKLFDWLKEQQDLIETEFREALEWERLDEKRTSRIAIYRSGTIDDDEKELASVHEWLIGRLLKFKKVFPSYLKKAAKSI